MHVVVLLLAVVVLAALLVRERRRRRALRGDYIGRVWALRAALREAEDEADELRARILASTLAHNRTPLFQRRTPPA